MDDRLIILEGDALDHLKDLETGSVHCVVTSPPYDNLRTYGGFSWDFEAIAKELYRVIMEGGVMCWNIKDSCEDGSEGLTTSLQRIHFRECGFSIQDTLIWEKLSFSHPDPTRYHDIFEYVFILSKGKIKTFNPIYDRRNIHGGKSTFGISTYRNEDGELRQRRTQNVIYNEMGKRTNIWRGATVAGENPCSAHNHPAMMPEWLAHDLVLSWSNAGDTVLDPFAGSGTTGKVALELGRKAVLIELNPEYIKLIRDRCNVTPGLALA